MNCLVLYHSKYGQTEKIARRIGDALKSKQLGVDVKHIDELNRPTATVNYDLVVIGAPLYAAKYSKDVGRFIKANVSDLKAKTTAFFSVSLSAYGDQSQKHDAERCINQFLQETGWTPTVRESFARALTYQKYNWFIRWMMKRIVSKAGGDVDTSQNYEYTDWNRVDTFAVELFERMTGDIEPATNKGEQVA